MPKEIHLGPIIAIEKISIPYDWALDRTFLERVRFFLGTSEWPGTHDLPTTVRIIRNLVRGDIDDGFNKNARTKLKAAERFGLPLI